MLPEESFPAIVENFIARMTQERGRTTSGELILFRSRALALAREADAQGKMNDARVYGELAEAALDDLDRMATAPVFGAYGRTAEGYDEARAFSRELHETFTRTFAGTAMQTTARGGERIPPELLMRRALGAGAEGGELRLRELEEATRFLASQTGNATPDNIVAMMNAQQRIIRLAAAEAIDPLTNRANSARLARFARQNEGLLDRFPEIRSDIQRAVNTEEGLRDLERQAAGVSRLMETQTAFGRILRVENPVDAVTAAINGRNPVGDLESFAKLARRGGPDAVAGLKASIWDHAIREASDSSGALNFEKLRTVMFGETRPGAKSLSRIMMDEGLMTTADQRRLSRLIGEAQKIEDALARNVPIDGLPQPDALVNLVLRVAGAKVGATMASGTSGATLVAAGRGSQFFRDVFEKVPVGKVREILIEAARNPQFAAALLEKPRSQAHGLRLARQIHAYIVAAGITAADDEGAESPQ